MKLIFISKSINNLLPPLSLSNDKLFKPSYRTDSYGKNSITVSAVNF